MTVWYQDMSLARASVIALSAATSACKAVGIGTLAFFSNCVFWGDSAVTQQASQSEQQCCLLPICCSMLSDALCLDVYTHSTPPHRAS